jgi:hypothetical protein
MQGPQRALPPVIAAPIEIVALPEVFSVVDKANLPALQASAGSTAGQKEYAFQTQFETQFRPLLPVPQLHSYHPNASDVPLLQGIVCSPSSLTCMAASFHQATASSHFDHALSKTLGRCCLTADNGYSLSAYHRFPASRPPCSFLSCGRRLQCCSGSATKTRTSTGPPNTCRR